MLKRSLTIFGNVSTSNMSVKKSMFYLIITVAPVRLRVFLKSRVCFEYLKTYPSDYLSVYGPYLNHINVLAAYARN